MYKKIVLSYSICTLLKFLTGIYLEYITVVVLCNFFWFWREIVFGVTYVLSLQYSCAVVSVFWLWWEIDLKMRTRFYKKILLGGLLYYDPLANVCISYVRPNTLLLCIIYLFCIFLLYRADSQVEVQCIILPEG
jgi:hypothetical protein